MFFVVVCFILSKPEKTFFFTFIRVAEGDLNVVIKVSEVILDWFYTAVKLNQFEFNYAISVCEYIEMFKNKQF